jgi:beta-lactamase regulating signal transducer with metallopeptidase domain
MNGHLLISVVENFVLLSTIFAIVSFAFAGAAKLLAQRGTYALRTDSLIRLYTWALILPPVLALWMVAAAFLPEFWMPEAFNAAHSTPHELHLLGDLTAKVEPTLAYMMLLFAAGAGLFTAWSGWRGYMRVAQLISRLQMNAEPAEPHQIARVEETARRYGFQVGLVMSDYPFSFVWGFTRSKLIVSTGLLRTLNESELIGVLEHEAAHHERRDNLIKLTLSFCTYSSLAFVLTRRLLTWRGLEVEQLCDEVAASRTKAPLEIASALVKLRRRTTPTPVTASSFIAEDMSSFRYRVSRLIDCENGVTSTTSQTVNATQAPIAIGFSLLFVGSLFISTYFFPLAFHHRVESLIHLLA